MTGTRDWVRRREKGSGGRQSGFQVSRDPEGRPWFLSPLRSTDDPPWPSRF